MRAADEFCLKSYPAEDLVLEAGVDLFGPADELVVGGDVLLQLVVAAQLRDFEQKLLHWGIKDSPFHFQAQVNDGQQVIDQDLTIVAMF